MPEVCEGICALVLSAGHGSRYRAFRNEDKLLAASVPDVDSPPILAATLRALRGVAERTVVVVRSDNHAVRNWLAKHATSLQAEVFSIDSNGIGHSLAQAAQQFPARRGWLVVLADMPYVQPATVRRVACAIGETSLVVPTFAGRRGHPRGIGTAYWAALLALEGDRGAQALFDDANDVLELALGDPGVVQDVDTPQDRRSLPSDSIYR